VYSTSAVFDNIAYQNNWSEEELRTRLDIKKVALEKMVASGDTSPKAVEKVIIETQIRERKNT